MAMRRSDRRRATPPDVRQLNLGQSRFLSRQVHHGSNAARCWVLLGSSVCNLRQRLLGRNANAHRDARPLVNGRPHLPGVTFQPILETL